MYFWGRINEKFDKIVKAFRYFDVHSRGILTFNDFKFCIEKLAIKLTDDEIKNIFAYIDRVITHLIFDIDLEWGRRDQLQGVLLAQRRIQE